MRLVLIHGRGQGGQLVDELTGRWVAALERGFVKAGLSRPQGVETVFPFYGDRLDEIVRQVSTPLLDVLTAKGAGVDVPDPEFRGEFLAELARANGFSDADVLAHYAGGPAEKGPLNWGWVHAMLRTLDRTPFGGRALDNFTRDVYLYLSYRTIRAEIDGLVAKVLTPGPCVVVGHSLGSVVGYNVLRKAAADVDVRLYVTLGSPLGLRAIRRRLDTPLSMPACVRDWYNAYDPRDAVALYPLDAERFPIEPPIKNKSTIDNHTGNRHGIAGYLDDVDVARELQQALTAT